MSLREAFRGVTERMREIRAHKDQQMREEYAQIQNPRFPPPDQRGRIANAIHRAIPNNILPEFIKTKDVPILPQLRRRK